MTPSTTEGRLQAVLHAYLQACDRGEKPDRAAILEAHPELRTELAEYFADVSKLEALARSLKTASFGGGALADSSLADTSRLVRLRYFGDYELLEEIARGGMGAVFKAKQVSLNRVVALKMILKGELASDADVRRFRQEAEAAANLDHPHIVPIYEVGEHDGQQYFSMKLIEPGPGFRSARAGATMYQAVAGCLAKVARAVHHAHERGILHRDLKPGNILIDVHGEPHVADFGLAKSMTTPAHGSGSAATRTGAIVGTPAYMAPEQARAEKSLTIAVDIYSLGAILYEWLTGRPPFRGPDAITTLMQVVTDEPAPLRSIAANIDADLETICLKCLNKEPAQRYSSAAALADDLERWQRGEPIAARSIRRSERVWRWCRRNPRVAGLSAALGAIIMALAIGGPLAAWRFDALARRESAAADNARQAAKKERLAADQARRARADAVAAQRNEAEHRKRAERERDSADSLRLLAESNTVRAADPALGLLLAVAATERAPKRTVLHNNALVANWQRCRELQTIRDPALEPLANFQSHVSFTNLAVSPDGKLLAVGADRFLWNGGSAGFGHRLSKEVYRHRTVQIREADTGALKSTVHIPGMLFHLARFSPDGKTLATLSEGGITIFQSSPKKDHPNFGTYFTDWVVRLWDTASGKEKHVLRGHRCRVVTLDFSPDGKQLATGSWDHTVRIWDVASGRSVHVLQTEKINVLGSRGVAVTHVQFSPDGQRLLTLTDGCQTTLAADLPYNKGVERKCDPPAAFLTAVTDAASSPIEQGFNGPYRAKGADQTPAQIWDSGSGKLIATLRPAGNSEVLEETTWAGFTPKGDIVTGHWRGSMNLWTRDGQHMVHWPAHVSSDDGEGLAAPIENAVFSKDSKSVVVVHSAIGPFESHSRREAHYRPTIAIRDAATGAVSAHWSDASKFDLLRFSNDGALMLALKTSDRESDGLQQALEVRRVRTGEVIAEMRGHQGKITGADFSRDGQRVISVGNDGTVRWWQADGTPRGGMLLRHDLEVVQDIVQRPQHAQVVTFTHPLSYGHLFHAPWPGERCAYVWDSRTGRKLAELRAPTAMADPRVHEFVLGDVEHAEYSSDGKLLVTVAKDWILLEKAGENAVPPYTPVRVWDAETQRMRYALEGLGSEVVHASFSPDGRYLLTLSATVRHTMRLTPDKEGYRSTDETTNQPTTEPAVRLWDAATGKFVRVLLDEKHRGHAALWHPNGKLVLIHASLASRDYTTVRNYPYLALYDPDGGEIRTRLDVKAGHPTELRFSPDGKWIVGLRDTQIVCWDTASGRHIRTLTGHTGDVTAFTFSVDGQLLASASQDGTARVWNVESGELLHSFVGHGAKLNAIAFSPDRCWLATASDDATARLWDATTGQLWMVVPGHRGPVRVVRFDHDSRTLFTGGQDGTVRSWAIDPLDAALRARPRELSDKEKQQYQVSERGPQND